jgi:hypothetical protein
MIQWFPSPVNRTAAARGGIRRGNAAAAHGVAAAPPYMTFGQVSGHTSLSDAPFSPRSFAVRLGDKSWAGLFLEF